MNTQKIIIGMIAVLALSACTPKAGEGNQSFAEATANAAKATTDFYFVTDWGSHFLVDKEQVDKINLDLKYCLEATIQTCEKCYGDPDPSAEELSKSLIECDNEYYDRLSLREDPPTFYSYPKGEADPYEEFWFCTHGFDGSYDMRDDISAVDVKDAVEECLDLFPKADASSR